MRMPPGQLEQLASGIVRYLLLTAAEFKEGDNVDLTDGLRATVRHRTSAVRRELPVIGLDVFG